MVTTPMRAVRPAVLDATGAAGARHALAWAFPEPLAAISSAPVGGGTAAVSWILNIGVTAAYARTDLDEHAAEVAHRLGLEGTGTALFTAVDVRRAVRAEDGGVVVDATVGVTEPTWAADGDGYRGSPWAPGTINLVVQVPVGLSPAAAVNAATTATEAKVQALVEAGVPGTGTASDAVAICWPPTVPAEAFGGPRSTWGARIARAVHEAVRRGLEAHP